MSQRLVRSWQPAAAATLSCVLWLAGCTARPVPLPMPHPTPAPTVTLTAPTPAA